MKRLLLPLLVLILLLGLVIPTAMAFAKPDQGMALGKDRPEVSADDAIVSVHAIGFVDTDGAKLSAIDIEYSVELNGSDVSLDKFEIKDYGIVGAWESDDDPLNPYDGAFVPPVPEIGSDPGVAMTCYVKDKTHVIIEVNTDYQLGSVPKPYQSAMMAGVTQVGTIRARTNIITPSAEEKKNYEVVETWDERHQVYEYSNEALEGTYTIEGTEVFQLFTKGDGAFMATDCWEEATGEYVDVELPYALYVPENYNPHLEYALVLHIHDAGFMGDDPMIALTESQGPVNFASKEVEKIAKSEGLAGVIVVCPQICDALRSTRDDYSLSAAVPATWQLMDYITSEYNIDPDRIYGEGQSMGGMQVGAMAAQRDNYFAAWWANGCQWGSNFNLDDPTYNHGVPYYQAPQDGDPIWMNDADGNPVNYRNWYYLVSDDNIYINNCMSDNFSTSVWKEFKYLYLDLAGAEFPYTYWNPLTTSKEDQSALAEALFAEPQPDDLGIYWAAFEGGNHMATWIYSHGVFAAYEWLLSQTRDSEMARAKLDLNKPFELADVQLETEDREIAGGSDYLVTGEFGAGTLYYNSALYGRGGRELIQPPGWLPLEAGAGASAMIFPAEMFAYPARPLLEGFNGVTHDYPYARVLLLEQGGVKVAICSLELVNASEVVDMCRDVVHEVADVPIENIWIHATHAITTPHSPTNDWHNDNYDEVQLFLYNVAVENAITAAAQQAVASFQYALAGVGTGTCDVNMNRDVMFPDGNWYIGLPDGDYVQDNRAEDSNKTMTVVRLDSQYADPIGFFLSYGIKPTCIDNSGGARITDPFWTGVPIREISPDVPGLACQAMEEEFGAPVLFAMPAAGDQVPSKWCYYQTWNPALNGGLGGVEWADEGLANGFAWADELGGIMADDAIGIANGISCTGTTRQVAIAAGSFSWLNKPREGDPELVDVPVGVIRFGDTAFVGFQPELNAVTEQQLWAASPFEHTLLLSFVNGDAHYMPDWDAYGIGTNLKGTAEAQKAGFQQGAAEELVDTAVLLLESLM